jgi:hypothetical protein
MPIIAANFTLGAKLPLDDRQVVETIEARNNISNPYEGLIVYVKADKTVYVYKDTT